MLVTTHTIVAMSLAVVTKEPAIYLPLALINHPVLDMVPHFGFPEKKYRKLRVDLFWPLVVLDAIMGTTSFFIVLHKTSMPFWLLFTVCLLAGWPDLLQLYRRKVNPGFLPRLSAFHEKIQTESPWLLPVEIGIVVACLSIIFKH